jgi:hypothetical protein
MLAMLRAPVCFVLAVLALVAQGSGVLRREDLDVTEGAIGQGADGMLTVDVPKMRAVATVPTGDNVELRVRDRGPVADPKALGSGEMRRQIALKLRAQDPCNLLYVSWRIEPRSQVVVQLKLDPTLHTSAECENGGYRTIKARRSSPAPELNDGREHRMDAHLAGTDLTVVVDGRPVWAGSVGDAVNGLHGPIGIRSDNGRFDFLLVALPQ